MDAVEIFLRKVRVFLSPRGCLLRTPLRNGAVIYGKNLPGFGGRAIYIFRETLTPEFTHLEKFLDPGAVFIDVGANSGIYAIKAAKHVSPSGGIVVAIEPHVDVAAVLNYSIHANHLRNVRLRPVALAAHTGTASFFYNHCKPNSFSMTRWDASSSKTNVLVLALDDLFTWEGLTRLDYVKIDANGHEDEILRGAQKVLAKYRPILQLMNWREALRAFLDRYVVYFARRGPGNPSHLCLPREHQKAQLARELGWTELPE